MPTHSPVTSKTKREEMDFFAALRATHDGKRVTRLAWANSDYGFMHDGWLSISRNGTMHTWLVHETDMTAEDWVIVG